jgi:hypothetical protein
VLLGERVEPLPVALRMHAASRQVVDDVQRNQVLLELSLTDGTFAQGTHLVDCRPILDADVAEGMTELDSKYPQIVRTGSSKTS